MSQVLVNNFHFINITPLISSAFLNVSDYNVILIDWREVANGFYWDSVKGVPFVSQRVALLIDFLEKNADLDPNKTMVIGVSLGAHVAGLGARFATSKIGEVIGKSSENFQFFS